ncbi:MAG TPA: PEP-CTERM sorting domain-containing protein [Verrucomicrobiae bacterium]|nr:PEP-CTERM sorting domain-containing protein [Verrucomicrobiae bacterium]
MNRLQRLVMAGAMVLLAAPGLAFGQYMDILVGDKDNFADHNGADAVTLRPAFASAMACDWETYNDGLRDMDVHYTVQGNTKFAMSFQDLPLIDVTQPVRLIVGMKADGSTGANDGLFLQYDGETPPENYQTTRWDISFLWGQGLNSYWPLTGNPGTIWDNNESMIVTQYLGGLTVPGGGSLLDQINGVNALDVCVSDDTGVDFVELSFTAIPEPSSLALVGGGLAGLFCLADPRRRTKK